MKKLLTIAVLIALLLIVMSLNLVAADSINDTKEAVNLYDRGMKLLTNHDYDEAALIFEELAVRFSSSSNLDLFVLNGAKAKYYDGKFDAAVIGFRSFVNRFGDSEYLPYAHFFLGNSLYRLSEVKRSVDNYLLSYALSDDSSLDDLLFASLNNAFENASSLSLSGKDFAGISQSKKCRLVKSLADIYLRRQELSKADRLLAECDQAVDPSLRNQINQQLSQKNLEIAVVVPLSGEMASFGEAILNGIIIGADFYRQETGLNLKIAPYDTKGDPIESGRIIKELDEQGDVDVVIGPLTSKEAAVSSAILNCSSLPLIAPAATEAGLTRLSETSFQLSPNIELEGIVLAEYAHNQYQAKTAVVVSSSSTENIRTSRAFKQRFEALGGKVLAVEFYRSRDKDFGAYLRDIKKMVIGKPGDSTIYVSPDGDTLDWDIVPIEIDCIFVPGDSRQLKQLIPQLNFYNIKGYFLGTDGWGDSEIYRLGDNVTKQAVFTSPFLEGKLSDPYLKLASAYDGRYGKRPQRLSSLGFDAVNLIIEAVAANGKNRDGIVNYLSGVKNYNGASGNISFGRHRENIEMPIYRINAGLAEPVNISIIK